MKDPPSRRDLREAYDRSAEGYDRRFDRIQSEKYDAVLARATLPPSGRVLDVGCGTGLLAARLAPRAVIGVDFSFAMLARAGSRLASRAQADALALPFADASFAVVFAITSLLVPESRFPRALEELARVLEPNGVLAVTLLRHDTPADFARTIAAAGFVVGDRFDCGQDFGWIAKRR